MGGRHRGSEVQGHPFQYREFKASLQYEVLPQNPASTESPNKQTAQSYEAGALLRRFAVGQRSHTGLWLSVLTTVANHK